MIEFTLSHTDKSARTGTLKTPHGVIQTPVFMPVGTGGTVKALTTDQILDTRSQIILANTYHLYLRPGISVLESYKGLHNFMRWNGPILTDSGGFQVMSLSGGLVKLNEEGVEFKSHIDGSKHFFTPEKSIQAQVSIGADIIMAFDQPTKDSDSRSIGEESVARTTRWLDRCIEEWKKQDVNEKQSLFGIVQGGLFKDLRIVSTKQILERNLQGIAIGGESIGFNKSATKDILEWITPLIPASIPRYTMGVGDIDDIFEVVERGVDMFDCVSPTRLARNGVVLISPSEGGSPQNKYRMQIEKSLYASDESPIDKTCQCYTCRTYSRGYISHLYRSKELLYNTLASIHNVAFLAHVCALIRENITNDTFVSLKREWVG